MISQRSTCCNDIDLHTAVELALTVARVSSYPPYSVAEFAWALALAVNRRIVRATVRAHEFDFRLNGLLGRDFHGRTVGVLGTGKIGTVFARIATVLPSTPPGGHLPKGPAGPKPGTVRPVPRPAFGGPMGIRPGVPRPGTDPGRTA